MASWLDKHPVKWINKGDYKGTSEVRRTGYGEGEPAENPLITLLHFCTLSERIILKLNSRQLFFFN